MGFSLPIRCLGNKYMVSKDKQVPSYEISEASYIVLECVREQFVDGFDMRVLKSRRTGLNHVHTELRRHPMLADQR